MGARSLFFIREMVVKEKVYLCVKQLKGVLAEDILVLRCAEIIPEDLIQIMLA